VTEDIMERLVRFSLANGKTWKRKLCELWERGEEDDLLRQARNLIGPVRVYKIKIARWSRHLKSTTTGEGQ